MAVLRGTSQSPMEGNQLAHESRGGWLDRYGFPTLISILLAVVLGVVGILYNNISGRLDAIDKKVDAVPTAINGLRTELMNRVDAFPTAISDLRRDMTAEIKSVDDDLDSLELRLIERLEAIPVESPADSYPEAQLVSNSGGSFTLRSSPDTPIVLQVPKGWNSDDSVDAIVKSERWPSISSLEDYPSWWSNPWKPVQRPTTTNWGLEILGLQNAILGLQNAAEWRTPWKVQFEYTDDMLMTLGVRDVEDMDVLRYDTIERTWSRIENVHDLGGRQLRFEITRAGKYYVGPWTSLIQASPPTPTPGPAGPK